MNGGVFYSAPSKARQYWKQSIGINDARIRCKVSITDIFSVIPGSIIHTNLAKQPIQKTNKKLYPTATKFRRKTETGGETLFVVREPWALSCTREADGPRNSD